jgi:predicted outer membrane protein
MMHSMTALAATLLVLTPQARAAVPRLRVVAEQETGQQAARLAALDTIRRMEALLATGDSDGVDEQLRIAEASLFGRTRLDVEAAREALARSDLLPAREYLAAALAERRKWLRSSF